MVTRFRLTRLRCQIPLKEVAEAANISAQRLSQIEMGNNGYRARNSEKLLCALESIISTRKQALESAEALCRDNRETMFREEETL